MLQAVADSETDLAAADIARQLRLHKSTVHRLLVVLEWYRLIKKGPEGAYGLGTRLIELGECAIARLKLSEYAEPHLRKIADETGEGAHVTILNGTELLSIAHVEGRWNLHSLTRTGQRTQIYCTAAGKAVLAFLSDEACDDFLARLPLKRSTRRTIVKPSAMKVELVRMRAQGTPWTTRSSKRDYGVSARPCSITGDTWSPRSAWRRRCSGCGKSACRRWLASSWPPRRGSRTTSVTALKRSAVRRRERPHARKAVVSHRDIGRRR